MAKAYGSVVVDAPIEAVWAVLRDFNGLPNWLPGIVSSHIEDRRDADSVGCVRSLKLADGRPCTERLLALDDSRYLVSYGFIVPAFPVTDHRATLQLVPVTNGDRTFVQWSATFTEAPTETGKWEAVMAKDVFAAGLASLAARLAGATAPAGAVRWDGWRPAKVFCSSVINAPVPAVWDRIRDFIGMAEWHPGISGMKMVGGVRPDKISGVRDFQFGDGRIMERLTYLNDADHAFRYTIEASPMPWLNYHAAAWLYPVTATGRTVAVWTADWVASANDDVTLIPQIHADVFQKAFDTLNERHFTG